jgi:hypothetical protein
MESMGFPKFYADPIPHISIGWFLPSPLQGCEERKEKDNPPRKLDLPGPKKLASPFAITMGPLHLKIGYTLYDLT